MKHMLMEVNESTDDANVTTYVVQVKDGDGILVELIECPTVPTLMVAIASVTARIFDPGWPAGGEWPRNARGPHGL